VCVWQPGFIFFIFWPGKQLSREFNESPRQGRLISTADICYYMRAERQVL
jgi:hypothetical protein